MTAWPLSADAIRAGEYPFLNPYYVAIYKDAAEDSPTPSYEVEVDWSKLPEAMPLSPDLDAGRWQQERGRIDREDWSFALEAHGVTLTQGDTVYQLPFPPEIDMLHSVHVSGDLAILCDYSGNGGYWPLRLPADPPERLHRLPAGRHRPRRPDLLCLP